MIKAYIHFIFQAAFVGCAQETPVTLVVYARGDFFLPLRCLNDFVYNNDYFYFSALT